MKEVKETFCCKVCEFKGTETRIVEQSKLTSDCFFVQVFGLYRCKVCEFKGTDECGGKEIIKKIKAGEYPAEGIGRKP